MIKKALLLFLSIGIINQVNSQAVDINNSSSIANPSLYWEDYGSNIEVSGNNALVHTKVGLISTIKVPKDIISIETSNALAISFKNTSSKTIAINSLLANETVNLNIFTKKNMYSLIVQTHADTEPMLPNLLVKLNKDAKGHNDDNPLVVNPMYDFDFKARVLKLGDKKFAPKHVWGDGKFTYLDYRNTKVDLKKSKISSYKIKSDIDSPVNFIIKNNIIIVYSFSSKLTLRVDDHIICIDYQGDKYEAN